MIILIFFSDKTPQIYPETACFERHPVYCISTYNFKYLNPAKEYLKFLTDLNEETLYNSKVSVGVKIVGRDPADILTPSRLVHIPAVRWPRSQRVLLSHYWSFIMPVFLLDNIILS